MHHNVNFKPNINIIYEFNTSGGRVALVELVDFPDIRPAESVPLADEDVPLLGQDGRPVAELGEVVRPVVHDRVVVVRLTQVVKATVRVLGEVVRLAWGRE